jgi:hypothetical protein
MPAQQTPQFLVLIPTTHATFDAAAPLASTTTSASAVTDVPISTADLAIAAEQKTRRSSSTTSASSNDSVAPLADAEPAIVMGFGQGEFLKLGY